MKTHFWEKNEAVFLVFAVLAILVGTVVTMVLPFAWVNTEEDRIEGVRPYTPLELAGRDVYIREGCNNCHTQTVRPLVAEVKRYGDYSKSGEFVYDRPHLWGSRRTGPDLARIGGKYPDAWHVQHMRDPQSMIPKSNMPAYAFLADTRVDPDYTRRKMEVLGFPYTEQQIGELGTRNELDAIVAYLQKLGNDIPWRQSARAVTVGNLTNPSPGDRAAVEAGEELYEQHCSACHGEELQGEIGPELPTGVYEDTELFQIIYQGEPDEGMPSFAEIGPSRIWQLVNFINYRKED